MFSHLLAAGIGMVCEKVFSKNDKYREITNVPVDAVFNKIGDAQQKIGVYRQNGNWAKLTEKFVGENPSIHAVFVNMDKNEKHYYQVNIGKFLEECKLEGNEKTDAVLVHMKELATIQRAAKEQAQATPVTPEAPANAQTASGF
jgi:hypothetical protein